MQGDWIDKLAGRPLDEVSRQVFVGSLVVVAVLLIGFALIGIGRALDGPPPTAYECRVEYVQDNADGIWPDSAVDGKLQNCLREARQR